MSWLLTSPTPSYAEEQLGVQLSALATLPVNFHATSSVSSRKPSPAIENALHKLGGSAPVTRQELIDVLKSLSQEGSSASAFGFSSDDGGGAIEAEVIGRAVTVVWKEVIQALIEAALELEKERSWWNATVSSRREVATYLFQSLPLRLYKAVEPASFSVASLRAFHFPSRSALFRPLPNASAALTSITSPYTLARREVLSSIKALESARDNMARRIGKLASDGPEWDDLGGGEYSDEVGRIYGALCNVLEIPTAATTPTSKRSRAAAIQREREYISATATPTSLLTILTTHLPKVRALTDETLTLHRRPSALTRLWFPLLFLPPTLLFTGRYLVRNKAWFEEQVRNARETVRGFFVSWVWEPLEDVAKTIRGGGEGLGVAPTTVKSDQESLERMVLDLGRDYYHLSGSQLDALRDKVASGDMEEVLKVYEKELQSPVKNALMGNLIRTLLIQVQKTKTDLSLSLLSLDHLLRSQQLTFAFVGFAPSLLLIYGLGSWARGVWRGEKRGKGRKRDYFNGLREVERIILTAPKNQQELPDRDRGLLIVSMTGLRTWSAGLGNSSRESFLADLRLLETARMSRGDKLRVVGRIWRCFGTDGKRKLMLWRCATQFLLLATHQSTIGSLFSAPQESEAPNLWGHQDGSFDAQRRVKRNGKEDEQEVRSKMKLGKKRPRSGNELNLNSVLLALGLGIKSTSAIHFTSGHPGLLRTRMDPLAMPGQVSPHVHLFAGTNHITKNLNQASASEGTCTTAPVSVDKSSYWAPSMYYQHEDGTFTAIPGDDESHSLSGTHTHPVYWLLCLWKQTQLTYARMNIYYILDKGMDGPEPFGVVPEGFRMLGGFKTRDFYDPKNASHGAVSFQCFGPGYDFRSPWIPADRECESIRPQVYFPTCWDGVNAFKEDNSHVAYAEKYYEYGPCPKTHPKRLPAIFLETYVHPHTIPGYKWRPGALHLSNGDNFGLTHHADIIMGWPVGMLKEAYEKCPNMKGSVADCPVFAPYLNNDQARNCDSYGDIVNEPVGLDARLPKLPGNNPSFNSSREGNKPRRPDPNYVETAAIVPYNKANGGACKSNRCTDYKGPRDAPPATAPVPSAQQPQPEPEQLPEEQPQSSRAPGGGAVTTAPVADPTATTAPNPNLTQMTTVGATTTTQIGGGFNAPPTETLPVENDDDEEEPVCTKRKRPHKPQSVKRRLPVGH